MNRRAIVALVLGSACVVLVTVWAGRIGLAEGAIDDVLASRGVSASYSVRDIGARWQRIENVRIGNPGSPDLTADWAKVRLSVSLGGLTVSAIRAGGVRLRGRIASGRLSLGAVDKLLPGGDGKTAFVLPDIDVTLVDARGQLATPWGEIRIGLDGNGNLRDGFAGKLSAVAPTLGTPGCAGHNVAAFFDVSVRNRRPIVDGPVRAGAIRCAGVGATGLVAAINGTLNASLDEWRGSAGFQAAGLRSGSADLRKLAGRADLAGTAANTRITGQMTVADGRYGATRLTDMSAEGSLSTADGAGEGRVRVGRLVPDPALASQAVGLGRAASGTPIAPLLAQIGRAMTAMGQGLSVDSRLGFANGTVAVSRADATSRSGAQLRIGGGPGLRFNASGFAADTNLALSGGGFPTVGAVLMPRAGGGASGILKFAPYSAGDARLMLGPVRFASQPSGATLVETFVTLDGPLGGGRVEGLSIPISLFKSPLGRFSVNDRCAPLSFRSLSVGGLTLAPAALRICPTNRAMFSFGNGRATGGASVASPRMAGRAGTSPVSLSAERARFELGANAFAVDGLDARLGARQRLSRLSIGHLSGRMGSRTIGGRFRDGAGKIANVPLNVSEASGAWRVRRSVLSVDGDARVSDDASVPRFTPLFSNDVALRLAGSEVRATATLRAPRDNSAVARVTVAHDLGTGVGNALLNVASVRFGKALQPEDLTRLTIGVIANVQGELSGKGDFEWSPARMTSTGRFRTDGLDFAAAFGPVTGLKGEILFDDLLALATPPGQRVAVASINPGTPVTNGVVTYQLLPGQRAAIANGRWPFAGGALILEPTTLDLGRPSERALTFRVDGLDAAKFIAQMAFENLSATGTFDGVVPMIFDQNGGRIEGGSLIVRKPGGTLAYVGDVSNAEMNVYAKLAFDALKSIRYQNLTIALDGPLDGEIISKVNFNGINEAPLSPPKSFIARQFIGLPFRFNITIRAPFRSLLNTARTFQDPRSLIQRSAVQPPESEPRP